jgi:hypothetical protein
MGLLDEVSAEDRSKIPILRDMLGDRGLLMTDLDIVRFLVARKFDVDAAYAMATKALDWFETYKPHEITEEEVNPVLAAGVIELRTAAGELDKQTRPVIVIRIKNHDKNVNPAEKMGRAILFTMHRAFAQMGEGVCSFTMIFDMRGMGRQSMDYALEKFLTDCIQNYYPERLGACLILYSGWFFWLCWKIIAPWLDKRTTSKIVFIDSGVDKFKTQVEQYIELDRVPRDLFPSGTDFEKDQPPTTEQQAEAEAEVEASAVATSQ